MPVVRGVGQRCPRPGVYVLLGADEVGAAQIYIGESDGLSRRLATHGSSHGKDFWDGAVAVMSPELNKAHARWLEAELVQLARASGRAEITNRTEPQRPNLTEVEETRVRSFLSRALKLLPLLGVDAFEGSGADARASDAVKVTLARAGAEATGLYSSEGMRVLEGSTARIEAVPSIPGSLVALRERLVESGVLTASNGVYVFTRDHLFSSPSAASGAVMGRSSNGHADWTLPDGEPLGSLRLGDDTPPESL